MLKIFHSNLLSKNSLIGAVGQDPQNDTIFRNKILDKMSYFVKTSKEEYIKDVYRWCKDELEKRGKKFEEIIKEVDGKITENEVLLKNTEINREDENKYKLTIKALNLFNDFLKEK